MEAAGHTRISSGRRRLAALQLAAAHRPDIVITDVRMPKLNGIEFAERLSSVCPERKGGF
ncbi:response regulator [Paenibacillus sp. cl141a]|uniref:response regulator n=1 Tax=Paenibacillus sp. cl141a TaxID=1761877 RepID=UPI000B88E7D7